MDPSQPGSLGGLARFAQAQKIPTKTARDLLQSQWGYTLHTPRRKTFPTLPVLVFNIDEQWAADLIDTQNIAKQNRGIRYVLTAIDVLSKYAWVEPVKRKSGPAVTKAFSKILKRAQGRQPKKLQTDDGKEFYNRTFQGLMKKKGIHHFSTSGDTKASVVERFNRTLKERLYRYLTTYNTLRFLPVLQDLVQGYNGSYHRTIGTSPDQVTVKNEREVWERVYGPRLDTKKKNNKRKSRLLRVGDRVRLNEKHRPFKKSYLPGWTEEVFVVKEVRPGVVPTYKIQEWDGTPLEGTFYGPELQQVTVKDDDLFRVEKVLKRKGPKVLVAWKGWPKKYNAWIDRSALRSV